MRLLSGLLLYRQELDAIVEILNPHKKPVKFESEGYEFESLDEIRKELGPRPRDLTIRVEDDDAPLFEVSEAEAQIIQTFKSKTARSSQLHDYLRQHRRTLATGTAPVRMGLAAVLVFLPCFAFAIPLQSAAARAAAGAAGVAVTNLLLWKGKRAWLPGGTLVRLDRRHEYETFWKRHEEAYMRALFAGIASLITGLLVWYFTKK